ncbi:DUF2007 domain-containing protein [Catenovulum adriaticum]|uniref:DUF2007 domain-containing protein n=1 Tax=Catenovulum adriaticum TaxID=2984846 RepID=A0ABY7ANJ2_9ALTE|nr:DUF2007 domain-containing protein [Catenovulum sp. TS8]WAJ70287.1 DUF2007 domain-containing protein [Catenovulum sp. TS8]
MKDQALIYQASNNIQAHCLKGMLEQTGIAVTLTGEALQGAVGELPATGLTVDLYIHHTHLAKAKKLIQAFENTTQTQWRCPNCHEINESTFEICWQCSHDPHS